MGDARKAITKTIEAVNHPSELKKRCENHGQLISPFDLPLGDFDQPVSSGQNRVMTALEDSINDLRSVNPTRFANRIVDASRNGNGRCDI